MAPEKNSDNRKPMLLVFAGPNGSGKSTISEYFEKQGSYQPVRIIRKHKEDLTIYPNDILSEKSITTLMEGS